MANEENKIQEEELKNNAENNEAAEAQTADTAQAEVVEETKELTPEEKIAALEEALKAQKDQYLRMLADFDNYRKNQLKKTSDLLKYGGENAFKKLLPIIDDFDRAVEHNKKTDDVEALKAGFELIYGKFKTYLEQNEVKEIPASAGTAFDENVHEAITAIPAPTEELKGKIVDCATKGYIYSDKVLRVAKVVVGQ